MNGKNATLEFSPEFLERVKGYALDIAERRIGKRELRHIHDEQDYAKGLDSRLEGEYKELDEAIEPWDERPDVTYYSAYIQLQKHEDPEYAAHVMQRLNNMLRYYHITMTMVEAAVDAKYGPRSAGAPKDIEKERTDILIAVAVASDTPARGGR